MSSARTSSFFPPTTSPAAPGTPGTPGAGSLPARTPAGAGVGAGRESISAADFEFLQELVLRRSAIVLDDGKGYLVESRIAGILREEGIDSITALVDRLRRLPRSPLETRVVDAMTTNETSFFRDVHPFDALPAMLNATAGAGPITIWCAAASSGQEPLSIAMTLHEKAPELAARTRIIATDLSPSMVERCRAGRFSQLEVNRGLPARYLVKYFDQDGTEWVAKQQLRSMIDVRQMNLAEPFVGMARCDLVMLRNVLIYFSVPTKVEILGRIRRDVLRPGGLLVLGGSETTHNIDDSYERVEFGRSSSYRAKPGK